ncbi:MAG: hypothetical protein QW117_00410 [Candidatus Pacearchaeota archaeon]
MEIGKKYLEKILEDIFKYLRGEFFLSKEKNSSGKSYACYICLKEIKESYVLIKEFDELTKTERRYHENCLKSLFSYYIFIKNHDNISEN